MAISTTSSVLFDGQRQCIMQFTGVSDGSGELAQVTIVDPKLLAASAGGGKCSGVNVLRITANIGFGIIELFWDAETPKKFAELSDHTPMFDYDKFGGLNNSNAGLGASTSGKVLMSTAAFSNGSTYMLELEMTKNYA